MVICRECRSPQKKNQSPAHFSLDKTDDIGYKESCDVPVNFMRAAYERRSQEHAVSSADQASRQRQILVSLSQDYQRHLGEVLWHRELVKGSVYELKTRCGNPSCHCAKPQGGLHAATVLSWSEAGKTHLRSLAAADPVRLRRLAENYRRLRRARVALAQVHRQILAAIDRLEQALRLPPPPPASGKNRKRRN